MKFDSEEAPHAVYNEYVANRIGHTIHAPVADGVLTPIADGPAYASFVIYSPGINLADLAESQLAKVARNYPEEAAGLLAFDLLIGNWDRARNLKATVVSPHIRLFCGFDHSHSLLGATTETQTSIEALTRGDLIVDRHPFYGLVQKGRFQKWCRRINRITNDYIRKSCFLDRPFRNVDIEAQRALSHALIIRKTLIANLAEERNGVFLVP